MRLGTFALKQWAIFGRGSTLVGAHRPQGKKLIMTALREGYHVYPVVDAVVGRGPWHWSPL